MAAGGLPWSPHLLVQMHLLHRLGHAWGVADLQRTGAHNAGHATASSQKRQLQEELAAVLCRQQPAIGHCPVSLFVCQTMPPLPGTQPTCATRVRLSELITLLLPTLGSPTTPTVMAVLMSALRQVGWRVHVGNGNTRQQ